MGNIVSAFKITVEFQKRSDGGIRITSEDVPGLLLSGTDPLSVAEDLILAIKILLKENKGLDVNVMPLESIEGALEENGFLPSKEFPEEYVAYLEAA